MLHNDDPEEMLKVMSDISFWILCIFLPRIASLRQLLLEKCVVLCTIYILGLNLVKFINLSQFCHFFVEHVLNFIFPLFSYLNNHYLINETTQ